MFSNRGYSGVSIRDICKEVGIKESSVYYHFESKQAIFDALMDKFLSISQRLTSPLNGKLEENGDMSFDCNVYDTVGKVYIEDFLLNDFCISFIKTINIEKANSESARELYDKLMFETPLSYQSGLFAKLMAINIIPLKDCDYLAVKYYAPVYFNYARYILSREITEENKRLFREHTYKHFQEFFNND